MSFNRSNTNGCPCKDCEDRVPEPRCHMTCQRFKEWREKMDRISEEERKHGSMTMSDAKRRAIWKKSRYSSQQLNRHHRKLEND